MAKPAEGCAKPSKGILRPESEGATDSAAAPVREETKMLARVGAEAPDFETTGYFNGEFINVKLSDYRGKWILLCFYPGDFTFV